MLVRGTRDGYVRLAVGGLFWLLPLGAYADERDAAEIAHGIWILGIFSIFFITVMSFAIWLLIVRLRSGPDSVPEVAPSYPTLEKVWSKDARNSAANPPISPGST